MVLFTIIVGINGSVHSYLVMNCYVHNHYKVKLNLLQIFALFNGSDDKYYGDKWFC